MLNYYKYYYNLYKKGGSAFVPQETSLLEVKEKTFTIWIRHVPFREITSTFDFIGAGVPNAVYFDKIIDGVIKFNKGERVARNTFFTSDNTFTESKTLINSVEELETFFKKNSETLMHYNKELIEKQIQHAYKVSRIIKDLSSFLPITGFVLYSGFLTGSYRDVKDFMKKNPCSIVFEKLNESSLQLEKIDNVYNKLKNIVLNFKILNMQFYSHGDLANNCRNIITTEDKELKVIDIDSIKPMFYRENVFLSEIRYIFEDALSLLKCLEKISKIKMPIIDIEEIIISEFIKKLNKEDVKFIKDLGSDPWVEYVDISEDKFTKITQTVNQFLTEQPPSIFTDFDYKQLFTKFGFVVNENTKKLAHDIIEKLYQIIYDYFEIILTPRCEDT